MDFPDRNICVLDWDKGVDSTWREWHDSSEKIDVYCPIVMNKDNVVDIDKSDDNSHAFVRYVRQKRLRKETILSLSLMELILGSNLVYSR